MGRHRSAGVRRLRRSGHGGAVVRGHADAQRIGTQIERQLVARFDRGFGTGTQQPQLTFELAVSVRRRDVEQILQCGDEPTRHLRRRRRPRGGSPRTRAPRSRPSTSRGHAAAPRHGRPGRCRPGRSARRAGAGSRAVGRSPAPTSSDPGRATPRCTVRRCRRASGSRRQRRVRGCVRGRAGPRRSVRGHPGDRGRPCTTNSGDPAGTNWPRRARARCSSRRRQRLARGGRDGPRTPLPRSVRGRAADPRARPRSRPRGTARRAGRASWSRPAR